MKYILVISFLITLTISPINAMGQQGDKIYNTSTIKGLYRKIILNERGENTYTKLIELYNTIALTDDNSPYYHGILVSIYGYAINDYNDYSKKNLEVVREKFKNENKPFIEYVLESKRKNGKETQVIMSRHGFTQPEIIDHVYFEKLGVETDLSYDESHIYNFYDLRKHLPVLFIKYGDLKIEKYDDELRKVEESTYGDLLFEHLHNCFFKLNGEYTAYEKGQYEWKDFITTQIPLLKSHLLLGKAHYYTNNLSLAKYELTVAQKEEIPNEEITNFLYEINNQLLLEKNSTLTKGLPNKKILQGWFKPKKVANNEDFGITQVIADFNLDGLLDEAILLSPQSVAKFHNNMAVFIYISKPDGTFNVQKFVSNQIPQGATDKRFYTITNDIKKPVGGFVASLVDKNELAEGGCMLVLFRWDKTQQKIIMEEFGTCH